ncbi:MAG: glycosyltransferase [Thermodesulfobacteriota bacterium]|nr:glycosyltransferase [Thermodesulfobacteriota bacterium]
MEKKHRILFAVPGLYGHAAASLAIAKHLIAKGHRVGYCTGSSVEPMLRKAGVHDFYPRDKYQAAMDKVAFEKGVYEWCYNAAKVFTREVIEDIFQELTDAFESFRPDVVYIDVVDLLAVPIAVKFNVPYAHGSGIPLFYLEKDIPPMGTGWDFNTPRLNHLKLILYLCRTAPFAFKVYLSLKKVLKTADPVWKTHFLRGVSPYLFMFFTTDKVEYPRELFVPEIFYIGPSVLEPDEDQLPDFPWEKLDESRPLIYVATGTMYYDKYKKFYKNTLKALAEDKFPYPIQVVMAVGKGHSIDELGEIPPNFIVVEYAPQIKLIPKASVVVTHGGVLTINEALLQGKPMLVVALGGDRIEMAQRMAYNGAGIRLDPRKATAWRIRRDIIQLLKYPKYTRAAEGIMHSYKRCGGAKTGADLILYLADTQKPVQRKEGAPITIEDIKDLPEYIE